MKRCRRCHEPVPEAGPYRTFTDGDYEWYSHEHYLCRIPASMPRTPGLTDAAIEELYATGAFR